MALPRYQRAGVRVAAMPQVSTVGLQEAARTSQTLAQGMDRLAAFAFSQAEVEAQIQGAEFGALNTPTIEELKAGAQVPGDKKTVFGRAARKASLEGLLTEFEMEANTAITDLRMKFAREEIDSEALRAGIADVNKGLSEVLYAVDPASASALTKGIQTTGNSIYLNALETEQDLRRKDKEVIAEIQMRQLIDGIEDAVPGLVEEIVRSGGNFDPNGNFVSIEDKIETTVLPQLQRMALELSDPEFYSKYADKVRQKISDTKVAVVFETVTQDTLNLFADDEQLQSKTLEQNPKVKDIYDSLTVAEREKVREQVDAFLDEEQTERDQAEQRLTRDREKRAFDLSVQVQASITSNADETVIRDLLVQLENVDPGKAASFRNVALGGGGQFDQPDVYRNLLIEKANGRLTTEKLNKAFSDRHITRSTYDSLWQTFIQQQKSGYKEGMDFLKNAIGYPPFDSVANGPVQRTAVRNLATIENEYRALRDDALADGRQPPDAYEFFKQKALDANKYTPEQIQSDIDTVLDVYSYDGFDSWSKMLNRARDEFDQAIITSREYNAVKEALDKLIEYDVVYGPYEAAQ